MKSLPSALIGTAAWAAFVVARVADLRADAWSHALLLFAALVLVPLALELLAEADDPTAGARLLGWAQRLQLPAALLLAAACWLTPGAGAAALALPWAMVTVLFALAGLLRMKHGGMRRALDRLSADAALVLSAVGGAWTLADRVGFRPLNFDAAIVALTAVHFHYAGLLLPLFAGLVQRELWFSRFAGRAVVGVVLGVPALALGITATQLGWGSSLEAGTGVGVALAGALTAVLQVRIALETRQSVATRLLLGVSGAALFFGMVLGALFAVREFAQPFPWLGVPQMRMLHGTVNAIGFGLCGVLGWRRLVAAKQG